MDSLETKRMSPRRQRSRAFYLVALLLPLAVNAAFVASGGWQDYWSSFQQNRLPNTEFWYWSVASAVSILPLVFAAWELGRRNEGARLSGYEAMAGLRDVFLLAIGRELTPENRLEASGSPKDRPGLALAMGAVLVVLVPTFFLSAMPDLRTSRGVVWLIGAGLAMGAGAYFNRRTVAYLKDEPRYWDILRPFRLLNPQRYQPSGRIFVRGELIAAIVLIVWWLFVGTAFVLSNP
jgi:drug/metabolite transporter (DMT)-like permease